MASEKQVTLHHASSTFPSSVTLFCLPNMAVASRVWASFLILEIASAHVRIVPCSVALSSSSTF